MNRTLCCSVLLASLAITTSASVAAPASAGTFFRVTGLVSDIAGLAAHRDTVLVNSWGIVAGRGGLRVAVNGTGLSKAYSPRGVDLHEDIVIPPSGAGTPSGVVATGADAFVIPHGHKTHRSQLIFSTEDGTIAAWGPRADSATQVALTPDAVYKGLAIARVDEKSYLFVANFHAGTVDVFNSHFAPVHWAGAFTDTTLPTGYAPFNILLVEHRLYVAYAKQKPDKHDDEAGPGFGFINVFTTSGRMVRRLVSEGPLNSPWGMAIAPRRFGGFGHALLVGNFGDGKINAFDSHTGHFLGAIADSAGAAISIEGLWGLAFTSDFDDDDDEGEETPTLYFAAGIGDESHGLVGAIRAAEGKRHKVDDAAFDRSPEVAGKSEYLRVSAPVPSPARLSSADGIQFGVSSSGAATVSLRIYDAMGRLVAEPLRDVMVNGSTVARWNGLDPHGVRVSPGTYFYRGTSGRQVVSGHVVVLR